MGCGESKHAVSTADTISQSKRSSDPKNVKDSESTDDVKIPHKDETEKAIATNPPNIGDNKEKKDDIDSQVSAEANLKDSENVSNEKDGEKLKAEVGDQPKGESGVEKVKEDEIKEEAAAPPVVEDATRKAESETKNEVVQKENEANQMEEKEAEKSAEAKEVTNAGEEKIPSVQEKVEESAAKDTKST